MYAAAESEAANAASAGDDDGDCSVAWRGMAKYSAVNDDGDDDAGDGSATDGNLKLADENCDDERAAFSACDDFK